MKKLILTFLVATLSTVVFGQAKLELGVKVGATVSSINLEESENSESTTDLHFGAYMFTKIGNIGIQPEILYAEHGGQFAGGEEVKMKFINVPVLARFDLPLGLNLHIGPQVGFLTEANTQGGFLFRLIDRNLKRVNVGAAFGAGWDTPFGLNVTARYVLGLSDIDNDSSPFFDEKARNNTFQLSVGYRIFRLGK